MSKKVIWNCDNTECSQQEQAWELPKGWLSLVFNSAGREYRYCFCSYHCLIEWAIRREKYYGAKLADNTLS